MTTTRHTHPRRTDGIEYRAWMAAITGVCALGVVSALVPVVEHIVGAVLIGAALGWASAAGIRRELRIRRRLADNRPPTHEITGANSRPACPSFQPAVSAAPRTGGTA